MHAQAVHDYFAGLQERIVSALEGLDGKPFRKDAWRRPEGGGGISRVIEEGNVFERGGVNFSRVQGRELPPSASAARPHLAGQPWEAMGISLVLHPRNPYCPTVHLNVRFFASNDTWWFGGGMDLTPYYGYEEDARHFHATCKQALDPFAHLYPGYEVPPYYDSLLAKLIVWGETREIALARSRRALAEFDVGGIKTNLPFHRGIVDNAAFLGAEVSTNLVDRVGAAAFVAGGAADR